MILFEFKINKNISQVTPKAYFIKMQILKINIFHIRCIFSISVEANRSILKVIKYKKVGIKFIKSKKLKV